MSNNPSSLPSSPPPPLKITTAPPVGSNSNNNKRRGSLFREPLPSAFRPVQQQQQQQHRAAAGRRNSIADVFLSGEDLVRNLGSDYEEVQKRTLTSWVNAKLRALDDHINNIETDLKDGKRLLKLLSIVSGQPGPKPERMNMRIHQLANVAQALGFLQKLVRPDSLPDIGNEAIVNGDVKKTLALIFYIMLKFQIQVILADHGENYMQSIAQLSQCTSPFPSSPSPLSDAGINDSSLPPTTPRSRRKSIAVASDKSLHSASEAKIALLYWVRIQLEDYTTANIISQIQDFSRSWRTGLAFCLLLHRHDPVLIPDLLTSHVNNNDLSSKETWRKLLTTAFDVAAFQLDIPRYLDPEDLIDVEHPHEPSVMMYVSEYYKVMSAVQRQESDQTRRAKTSKRRAVIAMVAGDDEEDLHHIPSPLIFMDEPESLEDIIEDADEGTVMEGATTKEVTCPVVTSRRAPLEAPVPIPIPSSRACHPSELPFDETVKAPIHQDIDSTLMMQLTGHLPRGVHPILDQLLTIHDEAMAFIKTYAQIIDELPIELNGSDAVAEAIGIIETIEEKMPVHTARLSLAKESCNSITASPETSILRLTQLQRDHVTQLYQVLITTWQDFEELVKVTRSDLERVEMDVVGAEDAIRVFKERAAAVELEMVALGKPVRELRQPTLEFEGLDEYEQGANDAMIQFQAFKENSWRIYCLTVLNLGQNGRCSVAHHIDLVQKVYNDLEEAVHKAKQNSQSFRRGIAFRKALDTIDKDLASAQALMEAGNTDQKTPVTDEAISILEERLGSVRNQLQGVREEYDELFDDPSLGFSGIYVQIHNRYRTVNDWVDQIRVWFVEAGRISKWIEERIGLLDTRNQQSAMINPFEPDFKLTKLADVAKKVNFEHEKLKREVDVFDGDDMTRLRNHVKKLTLTDQSAGQHKLSPADASTIEITLATLNRLHRLQKLIHERSEFVDIIVLRVEWEQMFSEAQAWIETTHQETSSFMNGGKARYQRGARAEEVIATLVALEQKVTEFDQTSYAAVLEQYQAMEDLCELPAHLEARQSAFEDSFAELMQRRAFCRTVVEQYIAVADVVARFERLLDHGELLLHNDRDNANVESILVFKDTSAHLIAEVTHTIPYPEEVPNTAMAAEDTQYNIQGNATIRQLISDYSMQLAVVAEQLEEMVAEQRQNMSLQERASAVYHEIVRVTTWVEGRMASLVSPLDMVVTTGDTNVDELLRAEQERAGLEDRIRQMDYGSLVDRAHAIEAEIVETNSAVIDLPEFLDAVGKLKAAYLKIIATLDRQKSESSVCRTFVAWQTQWNETDKAINNLSHFLWEFTGKRAIFDPAREGESTLTLVDVEMQKQMMHTILTRKGQIENERFPEAMRLYKSFVEECTSVGITKHHLPDHCQELQSKHDEMKSLFEYATQAMRQRDAIMGWLDKVSRAIEQGHVMCDALDKAQERCISQQQQLDMAGLERQVAKFKKDVQQLQDSVAMLSEYEPKDPSVGDQLQWEFDVIDPYEYHTRIQRQIRAFMDAKKYELGQAEDQVDSLYRLVQNTSKTKELLDLHSAQIIATREWITVRIDQERDRSVDTSSVLSEQRIMDRQKEHQCLMDEIKQFEESRLQPLQDALLVLAASDQLQKRDGAAQLQRGLDEVLLDAGELKKLLADGSAAAGAALKRIHWEQQYVSAASQIRTLNDQLRQLAKEREAISVDRVEDQIPNWHQQIRQFREDLDKFTQNKLEAVHAAYRSYEHSLGLMDKSSIPAHIEAMMDTLGRSQKRASEQIASQARALGLVQQRIDWEQAVGHVLAQIDEQGRVVEEYIQHQARWYPETPSQFSAGQLKDQYQAHQARFKAFREYTLTPFKNQMEWHSADSSVQKLEALEKSEARLQGHFAFAKEVMAQQECVSNLLAKASELELEASTILEIMLKTSPNELTLTRVEEFKKQVDSTLHQQAHAIPYPERQKADDFQVKVHIQDKQANEIIRDTISTRCGVLAGLVQSLDEQLASQQRLSICELLLSRFANHVVTCDAWIKERRQHLEQYEKLLRKGSTEPLAIAELQEALSTNNGLSSIMQQGRDSVLSVLESLYEEGAMAFGSLVDEKLHGEFDQMTKARNRIQDAWQQLLHETERLLTAFRLALEPTETYYQAVKLGSDLASIEHTVSQLDYTSLTNEEISQLQKRVEELGTDTYVHIQHTLHSMMATYKDDDCLIQVLLKATQRQLNEVSGMFGIVRATLSGLYDIVSLNRLRSTFVDNAKSLFQTMNSILLSFKDAQVRFKNVTFEEHGYQRQQLLSTERDVQDRISDCKDAYKDLCEYYDFIQAQAQNASGLEDEVMQLQQKMLDQWSTLQTDEKQFLLLMARTGRWIDQYSTAKKVQHSLCNVERDMRSNLQHPNFNNNTKTSVHKRRFSVSASSKSSLGEATGGDVSLFMRLEKRLAAVSRNLDDILAYARNQQADDPANSCEFIQFCDGLSARASTIRNTIMTRRTDLNKASSMAQYQEELKRQCSACKERVQYIKQQITLNQSVAEKKRGSIQIVVQTYGSALAGIRRMQSRAKESLKNGTLYEQANALVNTFRVLRSETDRLKRPLEKAISDIEQLLNVEETYVSVLKSVVRHADAEVDVKLSLKNFNTMMSKIPKNARGMRTAAKNGTTSGGRAASLPDLADFGRRYKATDAALQEFIGAGNRIKADLHKGRSIGGSRIDVITRAIDRSQDNVQRKWMRIKVSADETRTSILDAQKRAHVNSKFGEVIRYVNDLKNRVNMLQLSGTSIALEQQELMDVEEEIKTMLSKRLKDMDALTTGIPDKDGQIKRQSQELTALVQDLETLVRTRKEQAQVESNIAIFLGIMDKTDDEIGNVSRLVESCAPHHARLVENRFDKEDLQSMLRRLNTEYKEREPRIDGFIGRAKEEIRRQFVGKHERVVAKLDRTLTRWERVQSEVIARENDLQTCLHQLDHEFFTKLAIAKSTSTRTSRSSSSRLPVPVPTLSSSHRHRKSRGGFRSSTASVNNKTTGRRATLSHASGKHTGKRSPNYVVMDPKSELDLQLSRIANESSYRMKIRMVPGEVGKYWFGDDQPRLMYCRILPSKMVMVRVGGGWEELSQFLKSHGHLYISDQSDTSSSGNTSPRNSIRSNSPAASTTSTITLRGGGNRSPPAAAGLTPLPSGSDIHASSGGSVKRQPLHPNGC